MNIFSILFDVVLILVCGLMIFLFARSGFTHSLERVGKTWLSVIISALLGPAVTTLLQNLFIREGITNAVNTSLHKIFAEGAYDLESVFSRLPDNFARLLDSMNISAGSLQAEFGGVEATDEVLLAMSQRIAEPCYTAIASIVGYALSFIVPRLIMHFFSKYMALRKEKSKIAFFHVMDHIGGGIVGATLGYLAVLGIAILARTTFQVFVAFNTESTAMDIYTSSYVLKFLGEVDMLGALRSLILTVSDAIGALATKF